VPGNLCETTVPELREIAPGDYSKCHLTPDVLAEMTPVITQAKPGAAVEKH
jgi:peptide/nickel transport system ATP-binding protein